MIGEWFLDLTKFFQLSLNCAHGLIMNYVTVSIGVPKPGENN